MNNKFENWSTSISSLIERTSQNLSKSRYSNPSISKFSDLSFEPKILITDPQNNPFSNEESAYVPLQEYYSFKVYISQQFALQNSEIEKIKRRFVAKERGGNDLKALREDLNYSLDVIEKRCLGEIKKIMLSVSKATYGEQGSFEEDFKQLHTKLSSFDRDLKDLKECLVNLKKEMLAEEQEKLETLVMGCIKHKEFAELKAGVLRDFSGVKKEIQEESEKTAEMAERVRDQLSKEIKKLNEKLEIKLRGVSEEQEEVTKKYNELFKQMNEKLGSLRKVTENQVIFTEHLKSYGKKIKELQSSLNKVQDLKINLPNFDDFIKKSVISEIFQSFSEKQETFERVLSVELKNFKNFKQDLNEYVLKSDLEDVTNAINEKVEVLKSFSEGQEDLEIIEKRILKKIKTMESPNKSEIISDSLINKLVQLEQRVSVLEDFSDSESMSQEFGKDLGGQNSCEVEGVLLQIFERTLNQEIEFSLQLLGLKNKNS